MRLNDITREHFENPRNTGPLEGATHRGADTNPVCMDLMVISLRVTEQGIEEARFEAEGCPPTYAAGSILTERVRGQSVDQARAVAPEDVVEWLGGVPPGKEHVAHLAVSALRRALDSPLNMQ
ncbi:iron-sulfur cluster assembly scaffold protein [Candidatus Sumerlaeota bacterium]|nr:iron-sulfur cluster assembly scaffold protein [Candidatus Sumerlaeota bacterium]